MKRSIYGLTAVAAAMGVQIAPVGPASAQRSDAQIRREIVRQSIANYSGNCPCLTIPTAPAVAAAREAPTAARAAMRRDAFLTTFPPRRSPPADAGKSRG